MGAKSEHKDRIKRNVLDFNTYRDCGGGGLQFTTATQNSGSFDSSGGRFSYLNVPWGGARQSTLFECTVFM